MNGSTALADGTYRLLVCASLEDVAGNPLDGDGNGSGGDDFARSFRVDLARPTVTLVQSVADTGDGALGENEATNVAITELVVSFSEEVLGGDSTASFLLVEGGLDGTLDTAACGPLAGDDASVVLDSAVYASLSSTSTLALSGGAALADGTYRLLVCGTVTDLGGNAIDDDDDDDGNDDFERNFVVDTVPPTNPTSISSSTHVHAAWSPVTGFGAEWSGATDDRSGPAGYSVVIDGNPSTAVDCTIEVADSAGTGSTAATLGEGAWYVHVRLVDRAGNCAVGVAEDGFWGIDTSAPSAPGAISSSSHDPTGTPVSDDTIDVAWGAASDAFAGVASYSYAFDGNPTGSCAGSSTASLAATSGALADGSYYVHVCAVDFAGNIGAAVHGGPYVVDTAGPTGLVVSSPSHSPSTWSNDNGVDFVFSGATDANGVAGYAVVYDQASGTEPACATTQAASTFTGSSSPDGDHWWIHVRARGRSRQLRRHGAPRSVLDRYGRAGRAGRREQQLARRRFDQRHDDRRRLGRGDRCALRHRRLQLLLQRCRRRLRRYDRQRLRRALGELAAARRRDLVLPRLRRRPRRQLGCGRRPAVRTRSTSRRRGSRTSTPSRRAAARSARAKSSTSRSPSSW